MPYRLILFLISFFFSSALFAQDTDMLMKDEKAIPFQKLYLHTDREFYFTGDTIWFAAYLLDAASHVPLDIDCNLYVELADEQGAFVQRALFPILSGSCPGYIGLYDRNLKEGNYLIRAYTDYLKPFGDEVFFTKTIKVLKVKNSIGLEEAEAELPEQRINVNFYPEGGFLLEGRINQVAFEINDNRGRELEGQCELLDHSGQSLVQFETSAGGLGRFFFIPDKNETYSVVVKGSNRRFVLPEISTSGAKLMLGYSNSQYINLNIITGLNDPKKIFYIAVLHRGNGLALVKVSDIDPERTIKIDSKYLGNGVNRLVLLDENRRPLSERLVFMDKDEEVKLGLKLNAPAFQTRDKVELDLQLPEGISPDEVARLSVAIVNENTVNASGLSQNIRSYLLVDSELRGFIRSPLSFFTNDEKMRARQKLDLLMLTHGWSNYLWNTIQEKDINFKPENSLGLTLTGKVKTPNDKKVMSNSEVVLSVAGQNPMIRFTNTSLNGDYEFRNICYYDSALVFVQGKNSRDKTNTTTTLTGTGFDSPELSATTRRQLLDFADLPISAFRLKYLNELALDEFYPDRSTRLLEEVNVIGQKKEEEDEPFRIYGTPDNSLKVDESSYHYLNVFQYLAGRVPGVQVIGNDVIIRGMSSIMGSNEPLFLLDGMPIDKESMEAVPMSEIDRVEVLKGANAAIFGMQGGNGVISVFTRRGGDTPAVRREIPGTVIRMINGFSHMREFYAPKYTPQNLDSPTPDYRTTLYWNPSVVLDHSAQKLSFHTCDNLSKYRIFVEGITTDGKICLGEAAFVVDKRRE